MSPVARAIFIPLLLAAIAFDMTLGSSTAFSLDSDLDGDGQIEHLRLDQESDPALSISHGKVVLWQGVPARWQPWKLAVADVDGDGRLEIIVGVFKSTRYFPKPHNCLFIYAWDGRRAHPKWLGSTFHFWISPSLRLRASARQSWWR